ncbi:hypothetical protein FZEAL_10278 [Fusarium zealandicum]|uniref:Uncharacterized protein n=1 Tax=Fusarium zealandicum TaxID=1053134 RepID=A0A8H4XBQ4_9HYPO|nr:hypothetical protein FZEAL_10278 [Fusarium zealandicum]
MPRLTGEPLIRLRARQLQRLDAHPDKANLRFTEKITDTDLKLASFLEPQWRLVDDDEPWPPNWTTKNNSLTKALFEFGKGARKLMGPAEAAVPEDPQAEDAFVEEADVPLVEQPPAKPIFPPQDARSEHRVEPEALFQGGQRFHALPQASERSLFRTQRLSVPAVPNEEDNDDGHQDNILPSRESHPWASGNRKSLHQDMPILAPLRVSGAAKDGHTMALEMRDRELDESREEVEQLKIKAARDQQRLQEMERQLGEAKKGQRELERVTRQLGEARAKDERLARITNQLEEAQARERALQKVNRHLEEERKRDEAQAQAQRSAQSPQHHKTQQTTSLTQTGLDQFWQLRRAARQQRANSKKEAKLKKNELTKLD